MGLVWKDPKRFLIWTMFRGSSGHLKFEKNRRWNRPRWNRRFYYLPMFVFQRHVTHEGSEGGDEEAWGGWRNWLQHNGNCWKVPEEFSSSHHKKCKKSLAISRRATAVNYFYLPLCDLKSAVLVCKRWKGVADNSKLWEDKQLVLEEGENMTLSCPEKWGLSENLWSI